MLAPMVRRLTRILLAFCTAFVFTGQMEAAAEHCARLALAAEHATHAAPQQHADTHHVGHHQQAEAPPCHDAAPAAEATYHSTHTKTPAGHCECIAALKMCAAIPVAETSHAITPYAWLDAPAQAFASTEPDPGLRPPRA